MYRVSVGVPVYNGVSLIRECLQCLADQTRADMMEVVISDNASTDGTSEICAEFAERYPNFVHVRHPETTDAQSNFLYLLDRCRSPLFMWRAYDDLTSDNYVENLLKQFDADEACRLAAAQVTVKTLPETQDSICKTIPAPRWEKGNHIARLKTQLADPSGSWFYGLWEADYIRHIITEAESAYPFGWGLDHVCVFLAFMDDAVRFDTQASFTARLETTQTRKDNVSQFDAAFMQRCRKTFEQFASERLDSVFSGSERRAVQPILQNLLDRVTFSRKKILRTRLREALGLRRRAG